MIVVGLLYMASNWLPWASYYRAGGNRADVKEANGLWEDGTADWGMVTYDHWAPLIALRLAAPALVVVFGIVIAAKDELPHRWIRPVAGIVGLELASTLIQSWSDFRWGGWSLEPGLFAHVACSGAILALVIGRSRRWKPLATET